ncbi:hypothetical protein L873DRAFT_1700992, partial [Choiromyces venosus 120613-1]
GREEAAIGIDSKIDEVKEEIRHVKEINIKVDDVEEEINAPVDRLNNNVVTIGEAIMKAQNGDKEHSPRLLRGLAEVCKSRGC